MNDGSTLEALSSIISGFGAIVTAATALVAIQTYRMAAAALLPKSIAPPTRDEVKTAIQDCFHDFMQRFYILEELIRKA